MMDFIKEFWWALVLLVVLVVAIVLVCVAYNNGATCEFNAVTWNTSPANPASPTWQAMHY